MEELTPKQKAQELFDWFYYSDKRIDMNHTMSKDASKLFAEKLCNEVINHSPKSVHAVGYGNALFRNPKIEYFEKIKKELKTL